MNRPFSALLWKESREVIPQAASIGVVFAVMFFWIAGSPVGDLDVARHFTWVALLGGPAAASVGYWQTARERATDMWAFSIHRPASGAQIFGAKLTIGIGAVIGMMGVPYIVAALRFSLSSIPLDQGYMKLALADLFLGIVCYTCGLSLGSRSGGGIARTVPLILAAMAYVAVSTVPRFGSAMAMCAAISVVMAGLVGRDFITGSGFDRRPLSAAGRS